MRLNRRALLSAPALLAAPVARAQGWPDRPIRLVVAFPPGGTTDIIGRLLAAQMTQRLGQPVVVENRAGVGGSLGTELVAKARPDGTTLLFGANGGLVVNTLIIANLGYDPFRELQPIGLAALVPMAVVVRADHPAQTIQELVAISKARPGTVTAAYPGIGTSNHLSLALFEAASGASLTHVPYRGSGPMITDLLGGAFQFAVDQIPTALTLRREGKVRLLAITSEARTPLAPDLPTLVESGYEGVVMITHFGVSAPAGLPPDVLARLAQVLPEALAAPVMRERLDGLGVELAGPALSNPAAYAAFLRADLERSRRAVQLAGIKPE
jgi:tripartite-type tricarboxylate transporter receptor subunit TctC